MKRITQYEEELLDLYDLRKTRDKGGKYHSSRDYCVVELRTEDKAL